MFKLAILLLLCTLRGGALGAKFNFTISDVQQCAPVSINFSSDVGDQGIPMMLTVLPLSSTPVLIPIPGVASNTSGVAVTFLPLRAGQEFIASLDDASGRSIAKVSDLTRVLPSPNGNSSCLVPTGASLIAAETFKLTTTPTQCEQVSLAYDTTTVQSAPSIRVFEPKGKSFLLQQMTDDPANGTATYLVNVTHGNQVLFMFDDGRQHRQTSDLITVAGDTSSPMDCLSTMSTTPSASASAQSDQDNTPGSSSISHAVIIGCSVGGGVIIIIALAMVVFVLRDRKRRRARRRTITSFYTQRIQDSPKDATSRNPFDMSPVAEAGDPVSGGSVTNPLYVMEELNTSGGGPSLGKSYRGIEVDRFKDPGGNRSRRSSSPDPLAIQTLDIEGMLNMANPLSGKHIINQAMGSDASFARLYQPQDPQSTLAPIGLDESRSRHWRAPSDVPADPTGSGTFSGYSVVMPNPFTDDNNIIIPSPLIQGPDEPARPASDIVRPSSTTRSDTDDVLPRDQRVSQDGEGTRRSVRESREET